MDNEMLHEGSWWADARAVLIYHLVKTYVKGEKRICDVGCSRGLLLSILKKSSKLTCCGFDVDAGAVKAAREAGLNVKVAGCLAFECKEKQDAILLLDVLEHIENDKKALVHCRKQLKPNALLIVSVPSYQSLFSDFDLKVGHKRRYDKKQLINFFQNNGFRIIYFTYWNMFLLPAVFFFRKCLPFRHSTTQDEVNVSAPLGFLLKSVLGLENRIIKADLPLPFGVSMIIIAQKLGKSESE
ncbi:MAG: class I SAM-dependent methyltransferase [Candidatus Micrarchaeota archaeon]